MEPEGIDLTLLLGREGSWPDAPSCCGGRRAIRRCMAARHRWPDTCAAIAQGDRSLVAIPVFPLRNFTGRDLYVRKDGAVKTAADLRGKRVGMYDWVASGSIWYRHFLNFIDVPPDELQLVDRRGRWRAASPTTFTRCRTGCTPRLPAGRCPRC